MHKLKKLGKKISRRVDKKILEDMVGKNTGHQGIVVMASKLVRKSFEEIFYKKNLSRSFIR